MSGMTAAIRVEWWKLQRSPVTVTVTFLLAVVLPALGLGFHVVATQGGSGALALKASAMVVEEGWEGYLAAVDQVVAPAALVGAGVVVTWMFGREHVDRTFASLFALPVSRATVAGAKFLVLAAWAVALSALITLFAFGIGLAAGVGPFDAAAHGPEILRLFIVAVSTTFLASTFGWVASVGRGYLPAFGALILVLVTAQVSVLFGTGGWFPFAVPGLIAVGNVEGIPPLDPGQIALVPLTVALGVALTLRWWKRATVV